MISYPREREREREREKANHCSGSSSNNNKYIIESLATCIIVIAFSAGKAWGPWFPEVREKLQLQDPCLFLNGLYVCDMGGNVLWEQRMEEDVAMKVCLSPPPL